jgi:hypothetical protein
MTITNMLPFVMTTPINAQDSSPLDKPFTVEEGLKFMSNYHGGKVTFISKAIAGIPKNSPGGQSNDPIHICCSLFQYLQFLTGHRQLL